MQIIDSKIE